MADTMSQPLQQERQAPPPGAIDCDVHVAVAGMRAMLPYMSEAWREMITSRGTDGLELASYPSGAPLSCRPDWRPATGQPGTDLATPAARTRCVWHRYGHRHASASPRYTLMKAMVALGDLRTFELT